MNHEVLKEYENLSQRLCFLLICVIIKQLLKYNSKIYIRMVTSLMSNKIRTYPRNISHLF